MGEERATLNVFLQLAAERKEKRDQDKLAEQEAIKVLVTQRRKPYRVGSY